LTQELNVDLCVIGAGSGGLSAAAGAAQLGRRVVLCEAGEMGGDCLNTGCVPSKALIAAAAHVAAIRNAAKFGVTATPHVDFNAVIDHVQSVMATIAVNDSQERFERLGCTVIRARAAFIGPRKIRAGDHVVAANHFVIATGSSPAIPAIPGLDQVPYLTNETIFANRTQPEHLIVIGGGAVGVELAQAFRRLGSKVTLIEAAASILGAEDLEAVAVVRKALAADGIDIRESASASSVRRNGAQIEVALATGRLAGSHLLVATGRRANVDGLDLAKAGVVTGPKGIEVDRRLRTANPRIYAVGDVVGGAFTHVAGDHASTVIRNICFKLPARRRDALAPRVVYADPEIASIGLREDEAPAEAHAVNWTYRDNDRALCERETEGFVKIVGDRSGRILGATVVGRDAGDAILPIAFAMANNMKIGALINVIPAYPTRSEAAKRAAGRWFSPALFSKRTRGLVRALAAFD